jgi:hypothetical protein
MKKLSALTFILSIVLIPVSFSIADDVSQEASPAFNIERFVIAGSIENREPVGIVNAFASSTEKIYCFLEARDISEDTDVSFVWYHGEKEKARITLLLGKGSRWRTYSSKKLAGLKGDWKVELQDADGNVLDTVTFTVE